MRCAICDVRKVARVAFFILLCFSLVTGQSLPGARRVRVGAELSLEKHPDLLKNQRVGVICNHTSVLPNGTHLVDTLLKLGINVTALFSPEHGIRGARPAGATVENETDPRTGLQIHSLYGKFRKPTPAILQNVDILVFDLQDVGARFFTYASTMAYAMEAAAENGKRFIVLDRPNPINGDEVEGPVLDTTLRSFVGMFPIPVRHGLTLGELARMIVGERWIHLSSQLDLTVIPMGGWKRSMWYDETGIPWVSPSPNMKALSTAIVYPGMCLLEATNVSEGRGTEKPFEFIGAPWINGDSLAMRLNELNLTGVRFEPIQFTPRSDSVAAPNPKYKDKKCGGVFVKVVDRAQFHPVEMGMSIIIAIQREYPSQLDIRQDTFDRLAGVKAVREKLGRSGLEPSRFLTVDVKTDHFQSVRSRYFLY